MDNLRHKPDDPSKKIGRSSSFDPYWSSKRLSEEETVRHSLTDEDTNVERGRQLGGESQQRRTESLDKSREVPDDSSRLLQWLDDKKEAINKASEQQRKITEEKLEMSERLNRIESGLLSMSEGLEELKLEYEEHERLVALAEGELAEAKKKCRDLKGQISKEKQDEEKRPTKLQEERGKATKIADDLESLKKQLKTQKSESDKMEEQKEALRGRIEVERGKLKKMLPGDLGMDGDIKNLERLLIELNEKRKELCENIKENEDEMEGLEKTKSDLEKTKSDLKLKEEKNDSEFCDLDKSKDDLKDKNEEKIRELLGLQRSMKDLIDVKERCEKIRWKLTDEEYLRKLSESDQYEDCLEKIYIIGVLQPDDGSTIPSDLQDLLINEDSILVFQEDREKVLDNSSALCERASTIADMYNLRSQFENKLKAKQKESTNIPKFEIEDISAYDYLKVECYRLAETGQNSKVIQDYNAKYEVLVNSEDNDKLVRGFRTQDEKQCEDKARAFVDLSLEKFIDASRAAKMLESMIEYRETENSRILSRISLPEGESVKQRINAMFEQEVLQNRDLGVRRRELLDLFNEEIEGVEGVKVYIKDISEKEGIIRSFLEGNEKSINIVEGEINKKISRREEIKQDLERCQGDLSIKESAIADLERKKQTSQTNLKDGEEEIKRLISQINGIKDQENLIRALDDQYQKSEVYCQKRPSEIKTTEQQISNMDSDLQQARDRIASIEAKRKDHPQTISKLKEERLAHQRERRNAFTNREYYRGHIRRIELFFYQPIEYLEGQRKKLLASINQLQDEYDKLQKRKDAIEDLSIDDHQGRSELGI